MQQLMQRFRNQELTRREPSCKLGTLGLTDAATQALIEGLDATESADTNLDPPPSKKVTGRGGKLVMEYAKEAASEHLFTNPGSF